jgi:F-type H+-transporting ATPase subunit epsilon
MRVRIAKVGESLFEGEARSLSVPGSEGDMTILSHHEPLITALRKGTVTVTTAEGVQTFEIEKGLVEVSNNEVIVLL